MQSRCFAGTLAAALFAWGASAAGPALEVVLPTISQSDGGAPMPAGFAHAPGEVLFFAFQVTGFQKSEEQKVTLGYTVDAFDPNGVRIMEPVSSQVVAELTPHDKDWKPHVRMEIAVPPLAGSGAYKIVVKVEDKMGKTTAERTVPFEIRGYAVEPSDTLVVRNFRFFRAEDDQQPIAKPIYRPGDPVWARFDIIGYKFGPKNAVDVTYGIAILTAAGKVLWSQPEAAVERSESFYPKRYVPGAMGINLQANIRPGEYTIAVLAKDAIGRQEFESKFNFTVEQ